jgi:hypothetical protein
MDVGRDLERMRDYAVGGLSEEEQRAFEDRLLKDPGLVREFEQQLRLREGLEQLKAQGQFCANDARWAVDPRGLPRERARPRTPPLWIPALAAAALAGVALFLWMQPPKGARPALRASLDSHSAGSALSRATATFTFVATRGGAAPDLTLPSSGAIEFRAAPALRSTDAHYRVTLAREDSGGHLQPVGTVGGLTPSADGYVRSYADVARLAAGRYALRIEPDAAGSGVAQSYPFNLRPAGATPSR